jgi:hypothetical protein
MPTDPSTGIHISLFPRVTVETVTFETSSHGFGEAPDRIGQSL